LFHDSFEVGGEMGWKNPNIYYETRIRRDNLVAARPL
jgi:hypothetical protein